MGDLFVIYILNEKLTYQVDQISIVNPSDIENLSIEANKDLCTLVTCTPYGINTHRLLVRGHRVNNEEPLRIKTVLSNARMIEPKYVFAILCSVPLGIWLIISAIPIKKR